MLRKFGVAALLLVGFAFSVSGAIAADEKTPSIKDCMKFKGIATKVDTAAKAEKWDEAQKLSGQLFGLGQALGKNTPPQNADKKDMWEKVTKAFCEKTKAVDDAAKAKKAEDVSKAVAAPTDTKTCGGCHGTFKPKK